MASGRDLSPEAGADHGDTAAWSAGLAPTCGVFRRQSVEMVRAPAFRTAFRANGGGGDRVGYTPIYG